MLLVRRRVSVGATRLLRGRVRTDRLRDTVVGLRGLSAEGRHHRRRDVECDQLSELGRRAWQRGRLTDAYAKTVVTNAERDADSAMTALDSRQPPDEESIKLKGQADQRLQDASNALTDLRIALRRDDPAGVGRALGELKHPTREPSRLGDLAPGSTCRWRGRCSSAPSECRCTRRWPVESPPSRTGRCSTSCASDWVFASGCSTSSQRASSARSPSPPRSGVSRCRSSSPVTSTTYCGCRWSPSPSGA